MAKGTITLRDIITEEAERFGEIYAKQARKAIDANEQLLNSAKELKGAMDLYRSADTNYKLVEVKTKEKNAIDLIVKSLREEALAVKDLNEERTKLLATEKMLAEVSKVRTKATKESINSLLAEYAAIQKTQKAKKETTKLTVEERVQNQELNRVLRYQARENLGLVGAYEKLNRQRTEAQRRLANLLSAEQRNNAEIREAQREYNTLNRRVREVDDAVDYFHKNIGNYKSALGGYTNLLTSLVAAFGVASGVDLFTTALEKATSILVNYEAEVVNLAAIAGKTRDEIQPLEEQIQNVAKASINSATDVALLATELIKLGSTPDEAAKLLKPVNDLSLALRASAEDAATLVKSLLNAYQEGADQAGRFTDVLAESANRSALDFQGLRDAFSYLAPTAKTLNFSIERTAAILGILADNGIKAESAGRLTSTALIRLSQEGISLDDALTRLNKTQASGASELESLALSGKLFGAEAAKIGIILANNQDKIEENTIAYQNSQGALEELTNKQLRSLDAQIKILDSSFEDYVLKLNESTNFTDKFTGVVKFLSTNLDTIIDTVFRVVAGFVIYKTAMLTASIATKAQTAALYAQIIAQGYMRAGIAGVRAELAALNVATKVNPYALLATAIIGLLFYLSSLKKSIAEQTAEVKESTEAFIKSRDVQEQNITNLEKMVARYEELETKVNRTAKEQTEFNELAKALGKILPEATTSMNKYGEALTISADKIKDYVKLQKEVVALRTDVELDKNTKLLSELTAEQDRFNRATREGESSSTFIKALGESYKNVNGVLSSRNNFSRDFTALTKEELLLFKQAALNNETQIAQTEARIRALKRLQDQAIKTNQATGTGPTKAVDQPRTIDVIDEEIKAQKEKIGSLTYATRAEGELIDKTIAKLEKEREAIYKTKKDRKDAAQEREKELARLKKIEDDAYNLAVFRLNRIKDQNQEILDDENNTYQELADAAIMNEAILTSIAEENAEKRLKDISRYNDKVRDLTDEEISILIAGGTIKKTLNDEERLALEQLQKDKAEIVTKGAKTLDQIQLNEFQKRLDEELRLNDIALNKELAAENQRFLDENVINSNREVATEAHERKIAEIKRRYAIQALNDQIDALEKLLETETVDAEKRAEIEQNIYRYKKELSDLAVEDREQASKSFRDLILGEELSEEQKYNRLIELSQQLKDEMVNLANAIFDARIQKIDDEIAETEAFYDRQLELAADDQRQKELIEAEAKKKTDALEKKKREEQRKQAIFNKALKITETVAATALGIMQAYAQLGPVLGNVGAAIVGAIGALQLAAIIATPIPKYKGGRKGGPAETAIVGDGGVAEVVEDKRGNIWITPNTPTITRLNQGDSVHKSKESYLEYVKNKMYQDIRDESERARSFQNIIIKNDNSEFSKKIEDAIQKGFKKAKININNNVPKTVDIPHEIWASKNVKW